VILPLKIAFISTALTLVSGVVALVSEAHQWNWPMLVGAAGVLVGLPGVMISFVIAMVLTIRGPRL